MTLYDAWKVHTIGAWGRYLIYCMALAGSIGGLVGALSVTVGILRSRDAELSESI